MTDTLPENGASQRALIERIVEGLAALDLGPISRDALREIVVTEVSRSSSALVVAAQPGGSASSPVDAASFTQAAPPLPGALPRPSPIKLPVRMGRWFPIAIAGGGGLVLIILVAAALAQPQPGQAPAAAKPAAPASLIAKPAFVPQQRFTGNTRSSPYLIPVGPVEVKNGKLSIEVGQLEGMDGVYDYVLLQAADGKEYRFEAEDARYTTGDTYSQNDQADGHWWLQAFGGFSGGKGLVLRKQEVVPALTTEAQAPNGTYQLSIGSFTGDEANGVFGLGVTFK